MKFSGGRGRLEISLVPDAGNAVGQVHVIGEERLARGGVRAGDNPVVGAGGAFVAGRGFDCIVKCDEILGGGCPGIRKRGRIAGRCWMGGSVESGLRLVERNVGYVFLWCCEIDCGLGRWMITPGAYGVKVCEEFRWQLCAERFPV